MTKLTNHLRKMNRLHFIGILLLILCAAIHLTFNDANSMQAMNAIQAKVRFQGEYRVEDGKWNPIVEGQHIPATKGDVTLRGNFHILTPDGEYIGLYSGGDIPIAFYIHHINVTICEADQEPYIMDMEYPIFGDSVCGESWMAYHFTSGSEEPIEILIHNPHVFGNENAIDELLANTAFWSGIEFERDIMESGQIQRNIGLLFMVLSLVLLGSALFGVLLQIPSTRTLCLLGALILPAGIYLTYSAPGVSFWSEVIAFNTSILGFSMMFYMLFITGIVTSLMKKTKKISMITISVLGAMDCVFLLVHLFTDIRYYDTLLPWAIVQNLCDVVLIICLLKEMRTASKIDRLIHIGMFMLMLAFAADSIATIVGFWEGGLISQFVFLAQFSIALFMVIRSIPENIDASEKTRELELQRSRLEAEKNLVEAQLKDSQISIMLSQIQPHFIYNTLGTIERMCLKDPQKAFDLVRNFSLYLRGNFSELNSVTPIRFAEELKHIEHYVNIERVRFPDMSIEYNVETTDFVLPALSVQPLVENAIKHGLMRLESGGRVVIHSYETSSHFCVEVKDDGVGFDVSLPIDEKKHVGIRNIRGRLKAMVNGELFLESTVESGTTAVIMIPKDVIE